MKNKPPMLCLLLLGVLLLNACATEPTPTLAQPLQLPSALPSSTSIATSIPISTPISPSAPAPTPSATVVPSATPVPTPTSPPSPPPVPQPRLRQLTGGGCCTNPFWSADGRQVQFIDRPPSRPLGIYGVDVQRPGPPTYVSEWIVNTTGGGDYYVYPEGDVTIVQRAAMGEQYVIANGGRRVSVSPDGQRAMWQVIASRGDFDKRRNQTWVSNVDGSAARVVAETVGLGESQWIDGRRLLLVGLPLEDQPYLAAMATLTLDAENGDQFLEIARVARPRGMLLSPQGGWLIYFLTFQSSASDDGLWIVPTDGSWPPRKLPFFGSYRWRDEARLLYVPLEVGVESHTLWEYDALSGERRPLTDPARTAFKIANNDWAVSPDGRYVVFVSAGDHNLWLIDLEPSPNT